MGKTDFLDALRRAMTGLPPETQAKTLGYYEQRFIDGVAAGRTEEDVSKELDDPKKIAMTLRTSAHLQSFKEKRNPADLLRVMVSAVGLLIFNLFMVVPAMVYAALLATLYGCALAFYLAGIAITASGLSGANELALAGPLAKMGIATDDDSGMQTKVAIGTDGVHLFQDKLPAPASDAAEQAAEQARRAARSAGQEAAAAAREAGVHAAAAAREAGKAARQAGQAAKEASQAAGEAAGAAVGAAVGEAVTAAAEAAADAIDADMAKQLAAEASEAAEASVAAEAAEAADAANAAEADEGESSGRGARVMRRAESMAEHGVRITTAMDPGSRATQSFFGLGMVVGGILLFLLSLVVTKYTFIGVKRYIEMNFSLLKGN